jgi:hypothetical protein
MLLEPCTIEKFTIDYLLIRESEETIMGAEIEFEPRNQYIVINGNKTYLDAYYINEAGLSSDKLYHKIFTPQFGFWVQPEDVSRLLNVLRHRQEIKLRNRSLIHERERIDAETPFEYDEIDSDIYKCFIVLKSGMCDAIGTWKQFYKVEKAIQEICIKNGGRYFKNESKNAKFAIIFNTYGRVYTVVSSLKDKCFKVTSFEAVLEHFRLSHLFSIEKISKQVIEANEFRRKSVRSDS